MILILRKKAVYQAQSGYDFKTYLFRFGPNIPTDYEVPFDEDVFLLIFESECTTEKTSDFMDYLKGLKNRLVII